MSVTTSGDTSAPAEHEDPIAGLEWEPEPPPGGWGTAWRLAVPVLGVLAGLGFILLFFEPERARAFLTFAGVYVLPFGMDTAVPVAVGLGFTWWSLVAIVAYFDTWLTLFWLWNLDHLTRFERVHAMVDKSIQRADDQFHKRPWLARATMPGLAFFVFIPIWGTGSFTGIVIGKLIGMRPILIWIASMVGTAARVAVLGLGTAGVLGLF